MLLYINRNTFRVAVGDHVAKALTKIWLKVCEHQSALPLTPALNVPALREACTSDLTGLQKAARIVLAAVDVVGVPIDPAALTDLQKMVNSPIAD
jgi:hypothetical protein